MKFEFPNTSRKVLPILKRQLEQFGATVHFDTRRRGRVESIAGDLTFEHVGGTLTIRVVKQNGHFTDGLLTGGIRQMVEEAREIAKREAAA